MSYSYHIEHNHEWAIGAKFVIAGYDAQLGIVAAALMVARRPRPARPDWPACSRLY